MVRALPLSPSARQRCKDACSESKLRGEQAFGFPRCPLLPNLMIVDMFHLIFVEYCVAVFGEEF